MIKQLKYYLTLIMGLVFTQFAQAEEIEMADAMRANGKIYVVVAVIAIIFVAIVVYLISLDRKASKLEKELKEHSES
tara:strand:+ start:3291 stop:3521 length:231 start_codon:yes stop_codon:yes gene_type:complete